MTSRTNNLFLVYHTFAAPHGPYLSWKIAAPHELTKASATSITSSP